MFSKITAYLATMIAVLYIFSIAAFLFSDEIRNDTDNRVHAVISAGCFLDHYAVYFLLGVFAFAGWELWLRKKIMQPLLTGVTGLSRWKRIVSDENSKLPAVQLLASLSRLMLILFFVSQLSYQINHCAAV
ncbi:MAG: hypothetical protein KZQ58_11670 [gamma proteobacterium symbiont of Bathyaustriella thionipta]|nr:hypothetical protein [gamma proteobacterium symbiont of Bathyaustriella thionipta]